MNNILERWLTMESDFFVRFGLLFFCVYAASLLFAKSPVQQAFLWKGAFVGGLALAIWASGLPRLEFPIKIFSPDDKAIVAESSSLQFEQIKTLETLASRDHRLDENVYATYRMDESFGAKGFPTHDAVPNLKASDTAKASFDWRLILIAIRTIVSIGLLIVLFVAWGRVSRLRASATQVEVAGTRFWSSSKVTSPVVVGTLRPIILLPVSWTEWDSSKLHSVLAHERAHIQNRDLAFAFLSELLVAVFWFNPLLWVAKRNMLEKSELACDLAAIGEGNDRFHYARVLLEFATTNQNAQTLHLSMARRSSVARRVQTIVSEVFLNVPRLGRGQRIRLVSGQSCATILLCLATPALISQEASSSFKPRSYSQDKWLDESSDQTALVFRGVVLNADGTIATDAIVHVTTWENLSYTQPGTREINCREGRFEFKTPGLTNLVFHASNSGRQQLLDLPLLTTQMRKAAQSDLVLQLKESREFRVKVLNYKPLEERCFVSIENQCEFPLRKEVDSLGVASFRISDLSEIYFITAWTDKGRIGAESRLPWKSPANESPSTEITLQDGSHLDVFVTNVEGEVCANSKVRMEVQVNNTIFTSSEIYTARTDHSGKAQFQYLPKVGSRKAWFEVDGINISSIDLTEHSITIQTPNDVYAGQVPFRAQIDLPMDCPGGLIVNGRSFQSVREHHSTPFAARCDRNGNFIGMVTPGYTYDIHLDDAEWVSEDWVGIPVASQETSFDHFRLQATPGVPVEVMVTGGPSKQPLPNKEVRFATPNTFSWKQGRETRYGEGGRYWSLTTDENGRCVAKAPAGKLTISCSIGSGYIEQEIEVSKSEDCKATLHFDVTGKQKIQGQLVGDQSAIQNAKVHLTQSDASWIVEPVVVNTSTDGSFTAEIDSVQTLVYAESPDGKYMGTSLFETATGMVTVQMNKAATISGQVFDGDGNPIIAGEVRVFAKVRNPKFVRGSSNISEELFAKRVEVTTDAEGRFQVNSLPAGTRVTVLLDTGPETVRSLDDVVLEPGEIREKEYRYRTKSELPFESRFSQILRDTNLTNTHALVIIRGGSESTVDFTNQHAVNFQDHPDVGWYLPVLFDMKTLSEQPDRKAAFERRNWPTPNENEVWLLALNSEEEVLGKILIDCASDSLSTENVLKLESFLRDYRTQEQNAEEKLSRALEEAKLTDRTVWACVSQTRCNPCFVLARWQDDHKELLAKAFVVVKFDDVRDVLGIDQSKKLNAGLGVPWHVMLAASGEPLITSDSPIMGNIGCPDQSRESRAHFRKMLEVGARGKLSDDEIAALLSSLPSE